MKIKELTESMDWDQPPGRDYLNPLPVIDDPAIFDMMEEVDDTLYQQSGKKASGNYGQIIVALRNAAGSNENVSINKTVGLEKYLDPNKLKTPGSKSSSEYPLFYKTQNTYYVADGNHRVVAAHLAGEHSIVGLVLDVDQILKSNLKEGVGIITAQNTTCDVKPGETERQANKLNLELTKKGPKLLHDKARKNSSPYKLDNLGMTK